MIKILFIGMSSHHSGLETYTTDIFSRLQGKGFQFSFINSHNTPLAYNNFIENKGGKIYHVPVSQNIYIKHLTRYYVAKNFFRNHHNFNIIHINAMNINELYWAKAAERCGIKCIIIQSHNSGEQYPSKFREFLSNFIANYNKIYVNHHSNIIKLAATNDSGKWMFGKSSQYNIVPIGMDTTPYRYNYKERVLLKRKLGLSDKDKIIIITARLEKQKNYPKIIKVFNIIHKSNHHIKLVIIGKGSKKNQIKSLIHFYHLDYDVYFLGEISKNDVAKFLNIGDLSLIPSLCEAIPYSILEEQASGIPVVASKAIPTESNVTGKVKFLSLNNSNFEWAKESLKFLKNSCSFKSRIKMNNIVKHSEFSLSSFIKRMKMVYIRALSHRK